MIHRDISYHVDLLRLQNYILEACHTHTHTHTHTIQWNLSNPDANGAEESVIVSEVSSFQRLKYMQ